ncbi:MAG: hypothetical protein ACREP6_05015, partial [Candidatus Binataceae bacterium]
MPIGKTRAVMVRKRSFTRFAMFGSLMLAVLAFAATDLFSGSIANADSSHEGQAPAVGVWEVRVGGAPFSPHLFTFHSDHTFLSANPDAGDPNTSDSDGEGVWEGWNNVRGIFKEYNADRVTHQFVSILTVTYSIT